MGKNCYLFLFSINYLGTMEMYGSKMCICYDSGSPDTNLLEFGASGSSFTKIRNKNIHKRQQCLTWLCELYAFIHGQCQPKICSKKTQKQVKNQGFNNVFFLVFHCHLKKTVEHLLNDIWLGWFMENIFQ